MHRRQEAAFQFTEGELTNMPKGVLQLLSSHNPHQSSFSPPPQPLAHLVSPSVSTDLPQPLSPPLQSPLQFDSNSLAPRNCSPLTEDSQHLTFSEHFYLHGICSSKKFLCHYFLRLSPGPADPSSLLCCFTSPSSFPLLQMPTSQDSDLGNLLALPLPD